MDYYYAMSHTIGYSEVDKNNRCKMSAIADILQNTAILHSKSCGYGTKELLEKGAAWILLSWRIRVIKYPEADINVEVRTWYRGCNGLHCIREFEIYSESGQLLVIASSEWVFYDKKAGKPIKPFEDMVERYRTNEKAVFDKDIKYRVQDIEDIDLNKEYCVQRRDIDTNGHMNNEKYIDYALELIPEDVYESKELEEIYVGYKKQIFYENKIQIALKQMGDNYDEVIKNDKDEPCSIIKTWWK